MRRLPWILLVIGLGIGVVVMILTVRNGSLSEEDSFIPVAIVAMYGWAVVGAILASRNPRNPIGWLMLAFGLGFVLTGLAEEWAKYAYETNPGGLPLRVWGAWLSNWLFILVLILIVLLLLLYPTGSVPSPRWRPVMWTVLVASGLAIMTTILRPGLVEIGGGTRVVNPTGVAALEGPIDLVQGIVAVGYTIALAPLCALALILRFRRASGEERQQIRWLAYMVAIAVVAFVVALVSGISLQANETNVVNETAFLVLFVAMGIGFPTAIGVALLKYRLWDLDVVLKKTLVAAIVVILLTAVGLVLLAAIGGVVVGPLSDSPIGTLVGGIAIGALFWPLRLLARRIADRLVYGGRATPYEVLTEFSGRMAETYSTDDVLPRMAGILGEGSGAEGVTIWLLVGGRLRPAAGWPSEAPADEARPMTALGDAEPDTFEVRHQGELLGAITVRMPANDPMNPSKERLVRDLTSQVGLVLRNVRLIEELRGSRRRIVAAVDEGRRRLERDIHDGAQQQLVALAVKLRLTDSLVERNPGKARQMLDQLQADANDALENLRDLARGIYPPLLADEGLASALRAQARKAEIPMVVESNGIGRYAPEVEATVYFCVLEALQNIAKYARASSVVVGVREEDGRLAFEVRDDGVGFDPSEAHGGTGLQGIADRLEAIGGRLDVRSTPGEGTTVTGSIPVGRAP